MKPTKPFMTHATDGELHAVTAELRVLVMPSKDGGFVAQGLEIDYVATGATEEEAREHFATGFCRTILANLRRGRDLKVLFKTSTPPEFWQAYYDGVRRHVFGCVVTHDLDIGPETSAPHRLSFLTRAAAA